MQMLALSSHQAEGLAEEVCVGIEALRLAPGALGNLAMTSGHSTFQLPQINGCDDSAAKEVTDVEGSQQEGASRGSKGRRPSALHRPMLS